MKLANLVSYYIITVLPSTIESNRSRQKGPYQNQNMNRKEHYLPELELATGQVREALQAILYTILL
ncbi:MAG: hypothetical protein ACI8RD_001801 [Bacillariaceae sp.]|jgi:hypothetical protein